MTESVLVDGHTFFVTDEQSRVGETGGLFHRDTRHLSSLSVSVAGTTLAPIGTHEPAPWRRRTTYADSASSVNALEDSEAQKHTRLSVTRDQAVAEGVGLADRVAVANHSPAERAVTVSVRVDADFADIFEVRDLTTGIERSVDVSVGDDRLRYRYDGPNGEPSADKGSVDDRRGDDSPDGTDGVAALTTVAFAPAPDDLTAAGATYELVLPSQAARELTVAVSPGGPPADDRGLFERVRATAGGPPLDIEVDRLGGSAYAALFERARQDLRALVTETDHGPVPLAGVPWFATVFGRDALLAAYQTVHVAPELAAGTLRYLAAHQGAETDPDSEEQPGKIFHEIRHGELARRGLIPHTPYYGTVDATALWLVLLDETRRWTGDEALVEDCWPAAERALDWLDRATDAIGDDPFLYYDTTEGGLPHKAWRDTARSVQFADGRAAEPPLASAEVQGYVYDAYRRAADLARARGLDGDAREYDSRAERLREAFNDRFWVPEREYYGAALTGDGNVVDSVTSNVGQCLWSGIVDETRARTVVDRLLDGDLNSGWGIRTMSSADAGYSPVSYHVGSVWPHDNALIALGTAAYGFHRATETIATEVLDACLALDRDSVPELYCGFADGRPYPYPSACEPQAWGAATPFAFLRALFDLRPGEDAYAVPTVFPDRIEVPPEAVASLADRPGPRRSHPRNS